MEKLLADLQRRDWNNEIKVLSGLAPKTRRLFFGEPITEVTA